MKIEEIQNLNCGKILNNESLKKYTTYRLNETVKLMIFPETLDQLIKLLNYIKKNNLKYKILGGGANLIFDGNYDGIIIKLDNFKNLEIKDNEVIVGCGYPIIKLALKTADIGLSGLEFAAGIPGTIGGTIYNNAGAYKSDMGYIVSDVTVITPNLEIKKIENKNLNFHYRTSFFKENNGYVILSSTLKLKYDDKNKIMDIIESRKTRRMESQPLEYPSAGSVFRNPENDYAGRLIEEIGYKGKNISGAEVSLKHANFIINKCNATGKDIIQLINEIKTLVKEKYDIDLILEQEIVR